MTRLVPPMILLLFATVVLASCGGDSLVQELGSTDSSPAQVTGDGRYFGYVKSGTPEPPTISFDIAQAFFGDAANRAAAEDGMVGPGEAIPNDHYERNPVKRAETMELAPGTEVTAAWPASFLMQSVTRSQRLECEAANNCAHVLLGLPVFFTALTRLDGQYGIPAWVTVEDGLVVRIDEQYFP